MAHINLASCPLDKLLGASIGGKNVFPPAADGRISCRPFVVTFPPFLSRYRNRKKDWLWEEKFLSYPKSYGRINKIFAIVTDTLTVLSESGTFVLISLVCCCFLFLISISLYRKIKVEKHILSNQRRCIVVASNNGIRNKIIT